MLILGPKNGQFPSFSAKLGFSFKIYSSRLTSGVISGKSTEQIFKKLKKY